MESKIILYIVGILLELFCLMLMIRLTNKATKYKIQNRQLKQYLNFKESEFNTEKSIANESKEYVDTEFHLDL